MLGIAKCHEKMKQVMGTESEGSRRGLVFSWVVREASPKGGQSAVGVAEPW